MVGSLVPLNESRNITQPKVQHFKKKIILKSGINTKSVPKICISPVKSEYTITEGGSIEQLASNPNALPQLFQESMTNFMDFLASTELGGIFSLEAFC